MALLRIKSRFWVLAFAGMTLMGKRNDRFRFVPCDAHWHDFRKVSPEFAGAGEAARHQATGLRARTFPILQFRS